MIQNALLHKSVPLIDVDLMVFNHERRVRSGEHYDCIYTDEIVKCFPKAVVFERPSPTTSRTTFGLYLLISLAKSSFFL